jgi:hypothetical protein
MWQVFYRFTDACKLLQPGNVPHSEDGVGDEFPSSLGGMTS